jgi:autotransporter-associated beta strand protein
VNNTENSSIDLVYKGGELLWTGGTGDWDIDLTPNWTLAGNATNFFAADRALFNDTATTGNVNLVGAIAPITTKFQNSTLAYTLAGAALSGTGSVIKDGSATTTFLMPSSYSGTTTVNAGKLRIGDGGTIETWAVVLFSWKRMRRLNSTGPMPVLEWWTLTTKRQRNCAGYPVAAILFLLVEPFCSIIREPVRVLLKPIRGINFPAHSECMATQNSAPFGMELLLWDPVP